MKRSRLGRLALFLGIGYSALLAAWTGLVVGLPSPERPLGDVVGGGLLLAFLAGPVVHLAGAVMATVALVRPSRGLIAVAALLYNLVAGLALILLIVGFWSAATRWS